MRLARLTILYDMQPCPLSGCAYAFLRIHTQQVVVSNKSLRLVKYSGIGMCEACTVKLVAERGGNEIGIHECWFVLVRAMSEAWSQA